MERSLEELIRNIPIDIDDRKIIMETGKFSCKLLKDIVDVHYKFHINPVIEEVVVQYWFDEIYSKLEGNNEAIITSRKALKNWIRNNVMAIGEGFRKYNPDLDGNNVKIFADCVSGKPYPVHVMLVNSVVNNKMTLLYAFKSKDEEEFKRAVDICSAYYNCEVIDENW